MPKPTKYINSSTFTNPFLSEGREELWKKLEKGAKPISKEEVFKRARELKDKSEKGEKNLFIAKAFILS